MKAQIEIKNPKEYTKEAYRVLNYKIGTVEKKHEREHKYLIYFDPPLEKIWRYGSAIKYFWVPERDLSIWGVGENDRKRGW